MLKTICEKCQESTGIIRFPSLIIWRVMYHLFPVGDKQFEEPHKYHMWRFKPFSHNGTLKELANGKVLLENWFQTLKFQTTRWRVPQNIQRSLPKKTHIQLELDHTAVWYMQGVKSKPKPLNYYPSFDEIFQELARQSNTKLLIQARAKGTDHPIEEPLTDQEK